jgi:hypothetical protein
VCQMMGGLAYMTGPAGRPLRAGASVLDIMGGSYGVIGIMTALYERGRTGRGRYVLATLFESVVLLMAQHMAAAAVTGQAQPSMPERGRAWSVYDLFVRPMRIRCSWEAPAMPIGSGSASISAMTISWQTAGLPPATTVWPSATFSYRNFVADWRN